MRVSSSDEEKVESSVVGFTGERWREWVTLDPLGRQRAKWTGG